MNGSTNITAVYIDCIERILDHLEFADLLNVACSNAHLRDGANRAFVRRYGRKKLRLVDIRVSPDRLFTFEADAIEVGDLRTALQFIRGFGCSITEVEFIHKERYYRHYQRIVDHISEFCADILTEIEIKDLNKFKRFNEPFSNVKKVTIKGPFDADCFVRLFPNVRQLKIYSYGSSLPHQDGFTARHLPLLKHLDITFGLLHENKPLGEYIIESLRLNPQLTFLRLKLFGTFLAIDANALQSVNESLQQLERLELIVNQNFFSDFNGTTIHLKNVKNLYIEWLVQIELPHFYLNSFVFDRLETLHLWYFLFDRKFSKFMERNFSNFMERNSSIKRITIKPRYKETLQKCLHEEKWLSTIDKDHIVKLEW